MLAAGSDQDTVDREALDLHAEDRAGVLERLVGRLGELDAAGLAAAAGLDLGLDDDDAELLSSGLRLVGSVGDDAQGDWYVVLGEELLRLIFHQIHGGVRPVLTSERARKMAGRPAQSEPWRLYPFIGRSGASGSSHPHRRLRRRRAAPRIASTARTSSAGTTICWASSATAVRTSCSALCRPPDEHDLSAGVAQPAADVPGAPHRRPSAPRTTRRFVITGWCHTRERRHTMSTFPAGLSTFVVQSAYSVSPSPCVGLGSSGPAVPSWRFFA